mgnify:CR=1 FL=1
MNEYYDTHVRNPLVDANAFRGMRPDRAGLKARL